METSNRNAPMSGVGQIKKIVSKVIVITPKQIAEMGLGNQLKNIKTGTVIGQIKEPILGDGAAAPLRPIKAALLKNLRTKMSTLLNHSPLVMQADPKRTVELVYKNVVKEACEATETIEITDDNEEEEDEPEEKKVEILSDQAVHYSSGYVKEMLDGAAVRTQKQTVILNNNKPLQQKLVSDSPKTENVLCVADLTPVAASQITTDSGRSERERADVPVRKDIIDLDALIAAKQVIRDAAERSTRTVPRTFTPSAFRDQQVVRTYSKVQSISVVGGLKRPDSHRRVPRIHKKRSKSGSDDEEWVSPKRPYKHRKSKEAAAANNEKDLQLSVEEKVRRIMDECKEKEGADAATPVAPKKRGRPRKTPLQPKVDVEPESEKDRNDGSDAPAPRKRGRPRKVSAEAAAKDDKSSDDGSPKKKQQQRRRRSEADEREYPAPSSAPGGIRTSSRKRKVVDYAALSGGRISSSEEEDFAEIERLTGIKHATSDEESDEEEVPEDKEEEPSKSKAAVHPLKKRLKMEAAEKEKSEDAGEAKKPDETSSNHDVVQNNTVKRAEPAQSGEKAEETAEKPTQKQESQNSTEKEKSNDVISKNDAERAPSSPETDGSVKSELIEDAAESRDNQAVEEQPSKTARDEKDESRTDIACAVCKETFESESGWVKHKEGHHNNLAWKVGEPPLDLENYDLVCKTLTVTLKKYGTLVCDVCGQDFSSAIRFTKHGRKCRDARFDCRRRCQADDAPEKHRRSAVDVAKAVVPGASRATNGESPGDGDGSTRKARTFQKFSGDIKCAVCQETMPNTRWGLHRETKHNNLTWREGETPLNLEDQKLVVRILTSLYKQNKPLRCEKCGQKKKSVVGFISHKQQCQKSEEELINLKVECSVCQRSMLPVSMPVHMQLYHSAKEVPEKPTEAESVPLAPRQAAKKAIDIMQHYREEEHRAAPEDHLSMKSKKILKDIDFTLCDEVLKRFQDDINVKTYATCIYEFCHYQTENADDLMEHISSCDNKIESAAYTCNFCLATFAYRSDVWEHLEVHADKTEADCVVKEATDDRSFVVEREAYVDPLEYLDDEIACDVGQAQPRLSRAGQKAPVSKTRFMQQIVSNKNPWSMFPLAYSWTREFALNNFNVRNLFPRCRIDGSQIRNAAPEDVFGYLPALKRSMDVARLSLTALQNPGGQDYAWRSYALFEAEISPNGTSTIFCGGPVNCVAWVPTPHTELNGNQILSICVLPNAEAEYSNISNHLDNSLIQFWNFGPLNSKTVQNRVPTLEFCIAHKYGLVSHLEWCPSGCFQPSDEDGKMLQRMGLLAVSTGDSFVYIYSVPQPDQITGKILECDPLVKLSLSNAVDADIGEVGYFPTKTSWTKSTGHTHLAVGYSNGIVAVYSLAKLDESVFKRAVVTMYPEQAFNAHFETITALSLSHLSGGRRFLITGSSHKDLKLWDLADTSEAVYANRKCPVTDLTWNVHWLTPVACYDSVNNTVSSLVPLRDHNGVSVTLAPFNSRATSVASNDWGNLYVNCSDSGEVVAVMADQLNERYDADRKKKRARYLLSYTGIVAKNLTPDENKAIQSNKKAQLKSKKVTPENVINCGPRNYAEAKNNYGLVFCDIDNTVRPPAGPSTELNKHIGDTNFYSMHKPDLYPMQSISKVALNQNAQSFHYYALGYQVGFVRVSKVGFLNKRL